MSERSPEAPRGKFASPRDAVLYALSLNGWDNESSGSVESPSGWFARISNSAIELDDLRGALDETFESYGLTDPQELVGHFLVTESNEGFVDVETFEDEDQLEAAYSVREDIYVAWEREEL